MGNNDVAEQLDAAIAECIRLERENAELREKVETASVENSGAGLRTALAALRADEPLFVMGMRDRPTGEVRHVPGGEKGASGTSTRTFLYQYDEAIAAAHLAGSRLPEMVVNDVVELDALPVRSVVMVPYPHHPNSLEPCRKNENGTWQRLSPFGAMHPSDFTSFPIRVVYVGGSEN